MKWHGLAVRWAGAAALAAALGCSSDAQKGVGSKGGAAGTSGASSLGGAAGSAGAAAARAGSAGAEADSAGSAGAIAAGSAGAGTTASACPENPTPLRTQGTLLSLPLRPVLAGAPFVFGQPNALADGGSLVPLNFRFYISELELLRSSGEKGVAVDVVSAAGAPEPYGVHLFNAEESDSGTLRGLAPPGEYTGLSFALWLKLICNQRDRAKVGDPLTGNSQMTWPHTGGFLFLRYEARYTAAGRAGGPGAGFLPAVHMGGDITNERVPRVTVQGAL